MKEKEKENPSTWERLLAYVNSPAVADRKLSEQTLQVRFLAEEIETLRAAAGFVVEALETCQGNNEQLIRFLTETVKPLVVTVNELSARLQVVEDFVEDFESRKAP